MSPAFRKKLRTEEYLPEQPIKHQEHIVSLAKRLLEIPRDERTLIKLTLDPRYSADRSKRAILFEPEAILPKNVHSSLEEFTDLIKHNQIDDAIDFGALDKIVGVVGYGYTRRNKRIPLIVKKWEFAPTLPTAAEIFSLGTIYLAPGNVKTLGRTGIGSLTGIQVVGRGLTPDDYLMNMVRMYAEQKYIFGRRKQKTIVQDYYPPNAAKVVGWFDASARKAFGDGDVRDNLRRILATAITEVGGLVNVQNKYDKRPGSSVNARIFLDYVNSRNTGETGVDRAEEWFESMFRSPQFWRWATARFKHILPRSKAKTLRKFVLSGNIGPERLTRLRIAEKSANEELMRRLV